MAYGSNFIVINPICTVFVYVNHNIINKIKQNKQTNNKTRQFTRKSGDITRNNLASPMCEQHVGKQKQAVQFCILLFVENLCNKTTRSALRKVCMPNPTMAIDLSVIIQ